MNSVDARKHPRQRKLLGAKSQFNGNCSVFDCVVRNISEGGAQLKIESIVGLPRNFKLYIPNLDETHQCEVTWNSMNAVGVRFTNQRFTSPHGHLRLVQ